MCKLCVKLFGEHELWDGCLVRTKRENDRASVEDREKAREKDRVKETERERERENENT